MSWLPSLPPGAALADALALRPGLARRVDRILDELWDCGVPPRVLELCRLRVASLLGRGNGDAGRTRLDGETVVDEATVAALPRWPTDDRFDATDRACLAFAEQWLLDVHAVTDEQVAAVRGVLGDAGAVGLAVGLALFEGFDRARLVLGATGPDEREAVA